MKKLSFTILVVVIALAMAGIVNASMLIPSSDQAKENAKAPEKSPAVGENWEMERVDFIHYAKPEKPDKPPKGPKEPTCYKLLGVKWQELPVDYVINPDNKDGLSEIFVQDAITASAETWDDETASELFNSPTISTSVQYGVFDGNNAVTFGDYPDSNVIGVTSIWFTRRGKQIVEFDILFNTDFTWGDATVTNTDPVMDLANIATHELGHAIGLDDIYRTNCSAVTMYGYSDYGETQKRTLEDPDVIGLQKLYGGM